MSKYRVVGIREETPAEAEQRKWFAQQVVESPRNLEEAARLIVGLVTGLLGVLFGVLTIASDPVPGYLGQPLVRILGVATVGLLLLSALAALDVVLPRRWQANPARPETQAAVFDRLLRDKTRSLLVATLTFGLGLVALGAVLIVALLSVE